MRTEKKINQQIESKQKIRIMVKNNPTKNQEFVYHIQVLSGQWTKISCSVFRTHKCAQCELIVNSSQAKAAALQQTYSTTVYYKYCPVWWLLLAAAVAACWLAGSLVYDVVSEKYGKIRRVFDSS